MPDPRPKIISPDTLKTQRIPPGQSKTEKWPVLHYGDAPRVDVKNWDFRIFGEVEKEWRCRWDEFKALPWVDVACDIHCVTRWSRLNNTFSGPATKTILDKVKLKPAAKFVLVHCEQGFTTNLPLEAFLQNDSLFAIEHDGKPLSTDHGFPVRLVVPRLYFWKSAKWVRGIELLSQDVAGFWEQNGYHMQGDPWSEQRHGYPPE